MTSRQKLAIRWIKEEGIEDMSGKPIEVNTDGTVTLYHRTSQKAANDIYKTGKFLSKENTNETFFSNNPIGQAEGYGDTIIAVKVPVQNIRINDAFPHEIHVAVSNHKLGKTNIVDTCKVLKTHDDGDLTLQCKDAKYVVTTEGKTFKEVKSK